MRFPRYIKYFFFLAVNWDVRIAWHMIRQEIKGEKKYGINTTGADELHKLEEQGIDISHATIYMPVSYTLLEEIFEQLPAITGDHFVDLGCGKGRALCMAAHKGFTQVTGLDFSRALCEQARLNLEITRQQIPSLDYAVINNDAFYFEIPASVDCIFFFNPFDEMIMSGVVKNILKSLKKHPRNITIIYVNPMHKELFLKAGFTETWYTKKKKYLEASILQNK
jgi:SAM-dependent methyltransferase